MVHVVDAIEMFRESPGMRDRSLWVSRVDKQWTYNLGGLVLVNQGLEPQAITQEERNDYCLLHLRKMGYTNTDLFYIHDINSHTYSIDILLQRFELLWSRGVAPCWPDLLWDEDHKHHAEYWRARREYGACAA